MTRADEWCKARQARFNAGAVVYVPVEELVELFVEDLPQEDADVDRMLAFMKMSKKDIALQFAAMLSTHGLQVLELAFRSIGKTRYAIGIRRTPKISPDIGFSKRLRQAHERACQEITEYALLRSTRKKGMVAS